MAAFTFYPAPDPPYVGPAAHTSGPQAHINRVVIHATVSPCVVGGARSTAAWFRNPASSGSAHYAVDPGEVVQVVRDHTIAWHAPPNEDSIGIEMCDMPSSTSLGHWVADPTASHHSNRKNPLRWVEPNHRKMLRKAARLTAELCLAYNLPVAFLSPADLIAGKRGITTHANVSSAWHQSTHWDPGVWPKRAFMREVRKQVRLLRSE